VVGGGVVFWIFGACGAVDFPNAFGVFIGLVGSPFGISCAAIVAVFLEGVEAGGDFVEHGETAVVFLRIVGEELGGLRCEEELGELLGGGLEADFGDFAGFATAEDVSEVILAQLGSDGAVLCEAPFAITTAGSPVGNVAFGDFDIEFVEGSDNAMVRDVVEEHAVDHVALGSWEPGDFAVAGALDGRRTCGGRFEGGFGALWFEANGRFSG